MWDFHTHVIPPEVVEAARLGRYGLQVQDDRLMVGKDQVMIGQMNDLQILENYADDRGLSLVLSVPPALFRHDLSGAESVSWCVFLNNAMMDVLQGGRQCRKGLATLPMAETADALAEWDRVGNEFIGIAMGTTVRGKTMDADALLPFWQGFAVQGGGLCFVHAVDSCNVQPQRYYLNNLLEYPHEDARATASLLFSGLPVRFSNIYWLISHGGGAAAFLLSRWQRGYETARPGIDINLPGPQKVFRSLWFDSVLHDAEALEYLMRKAPGHVVYGTDYPFPMGTQHRPISPLVKSDQILEVNGNQLMELLIKGRTP